MPPKSKRVLRGSASKKQRQEILSLATGSSPHQGTRTKKSMEKQAKSSGESSSDDNSTGTNAPVIMTTPFDAKLEHLLTNYLSAAGADHHIRKAFIHEQIFTFDDFTDGCTAENIKTFQRDDVNNNLVQAFSNVKLTMITNARLYYKFLMDDGQETLAEDPSSWVKSDFRKWKTIPRGTATQPATPAASATQVASNTTAPAPPSTTKLEDDALLTWRKSRQDVKEYPVIDNDVQYPDWIIKIMRVFISHECERIVDVDNVHFANINSESDELLWNAQKNHLAKVLDHVLKTNEGMRLVCTYPNKPRHI